MGLLVLANTIFWFQWLKMLKLMHFLKHHLQGTGDLMTALLLGWSNVMSLSFPSGSKIFSIVFPYTFSDVVVNKL